MLTPYDLYMMEVKEAGLRDVVNNVKNKVHDAIMPPMTPEQAEAIKGHFSDKIKGEVQYHHIDKTMGAHAFRAADVTPGSKAEQYLMAKGVQDPAGKHHVFANLERSPGVLAHELGHLSAAETRLSKVQTPLRKGQALTSALIQKFPAAIPLHVAASAPILAEEARASWRGLKAVKATMGRAAAARSAPLLAAGFASYAVGSALPVLSAKMVKSLKSVPKL